MAKKEHMGSKTTGEIEKVLLDTRGALREVRFASAGGRPADAAAPRKLRKVVARALTELNARSARGPAAEKEALPA
jgi:ribosomal protein L29